MVTMVVVQAKERLYHDQHPTDMFFLLANRGFWVLTPMSGQFFHQCASVVQLAKGIGGPPLTILCAFYRQRISLQRTQGASILKHVVIESEGSSNAFRFPFLFLLQYGSCNLWGLWNIICSFTPI